MSKMKAVYVCTECGSQSPKWLGQCVDCQAWNSFIEDVATNLSARAAAHHGGYADAAGSSITWLQDVKINVETRFLTGLTELDRVLGGGLVQGSVTLIGGDPGIGKSTLLLQSLVHLAQQKKVLYVTGEESLQQVTLRAQRLELPQPKLALLAETQVERIIALARQHTQEVMVIDSIQTIFTDQISAAPGAVSQVRESAAALVRFAKQTGTALFLVGHVTKEGTLAGPRVLEHMVDTVLYFEGEKDSRYRVIRAIKNRFGAVNELGIFAMTDRGLKQVNNPSALFLSQDNQAMPGSAVMVSWEGSRPFLVEVQALVDDSHLANPRRVSVGLDPQRLGMLLAVLHRHGSVATYNQDVFLNVVGGVRISETAADLAQLCAIVSSLRNRIIPKETVIFGEVGLAGEIRPVQCGQERLKEAVKHGFKKAIVPKANAPREAIKGLEVITVQRLQDALKEL